MFVQAICRRSMTRYVAETEVWMMRDFGCGGGTFSRSQSWTPSRHQIKIETSFQLTSPTFGAFFQTEMTSYFECEGIGSNFVKLYFILTTGITSW